MEFTLPSGRVVETREPTAGEEVLAIKIGLGDPEVFTYAKLAVVVPSLTWAGFAVLSRSDGRALMAEVNRIFKGTPDEELEGGSVGVGSVEIEEGQEDAGQGAPDEAEIEANHS